MNLAASTNTVVGIQFEIDTTNYVLPAGTWTIRLNVTTACTRSSTIKAIYICQVSGSGNCTNKAAIGSATGLSIALNTTGVKTQAVTSYAVTLAAGDKIEIQICVANGSSSKTDTFSFRANQLIDTPLNLAVNSSWQQTDTLGTWGGIAFCDGLTNLGTASLVARDGGTAGTASTMVNIPNGTSGLSFNEINPTGYSCPAGNWLVRLNVTVAANAVGGTNISSCYICQIGSDGANKATIASAPVLAVDLKTTGVKIIVLSGVAVTLAPGDRIEIMLGISTSAMGDSFTFVNNQLIDTALAVVVGNIYDMDTSLDVTLAETPALALARAGALTLGATLGQSDAAKLDAVGRSTMSTTLTCTPATQRNAVGAATLGATFSCSSAAPVAGTIYDVSAGTMIVTFGHAAVTQRVAVGATSLGASFSCSSAMLRTTAGAVTLPATLSHSTATQRAAVGAATFATTFSLASNGGASYLVTAGTMGVTMSESSAVWTARQGAATLSVTMSAQASSQGNVTSSAAFSVHPTISPASSANIFSATTLPTSFGFSTSSAVAAATYTKATSFAFTAGLSAPQPRLNAVGSSTLAATLAESSKSQANRLAGATLPIVPGLTALTALPVQAAATLASLFGLSSDAITNLATVIESLSLDALKASAQLSARRPGADLSADRGRTDLEAMKETTDLEAQKSEDSLGGEL